MASNAALDLEVAVTGGPELTASLASGYQAFTEGKPEQHTLIPASGL